MLSVVTYSSSEVIFARGFELLSLFSNHISSEFMVNLQNKHFHRLVGASSNEDAFSCVKYNKAASMEKVVEESWCTKLCSAEGNHWDERLLFGRFCCKFSII